MLCSHARRHADDDAHADDDVPTSSPDLWQVEPVLGLWSMVLAAKEGASAELYAHYKNLPSETRSAVFPPEHFGDLPSRLEEMMSQHRLKGEEAEDSIHFRALEAQESFSKLKSRHISNMISKDALECA